jgi:hypothetical protein
VECDEVVEYLVIRMPFGVPGHHGTGMLRGEGVRSFFRARQAPHESLT